MRTLELAVANMFCIGFPGLEVPRETWALFARGVSGAILFSRNFESAEQFASLCAELKRRVGRPLLTSVDQEGGRVRRLRGAPFSDLPAMRAVGAAGDPALARELGSLLGRELRAVNVDLGYAPVLDVDTNPDNPVIGDRSFSRDPHQVAALGAAWIEGMQGQGVAACGKHFPGHGDTSQGSHLDLPRLPHGMERLEQVELVPFARAAQVEVASIMTAHVVFEALDGAYPATMSRDSLDGILRDRLGYQGVVISDDLEMKAIADHYGLEDAVVRGALAGVDLFLVCHDPDVQRRAIELLVAAVRRGVVPEARIAEAGRRIDRMVARFVRPPVDDGARDVLGCEAHQEVLRRLEAAAGPAWASATRGTDRDPTAA
jgi:beta-N-acetylhexosaminidase